MYISSEVWATVKISCFSLFYVNFSYCETKSLKIQQLTLFCMMKLQHNDISHVLWFAGENGKKLVSYKPRVTQHIPKYSTQPTRIT